ncbi:MAG: hypothetical protein IIC86_07775, partial [Chloroflexi bacterium]|nr:hypothetical protein [Chloroflexota bacterium]
MIRLAAVIAALLALTIALLVVSRGTAAPILSTDKEDYYANETVSVAGNGFVANTLYDIPVIRPDGSIVLGDGSFLPGWDTVTSDGLGDFTYLYQLNGIFGTYEVRAYNSPWSGDLSEPPVAVHTFTDANISFTQCKNDSNNDNIIDPCTWINGGLNQNNSLYTEGSNVPQRLFHQLPEVGTHTFAFTYEFSNSDIYAFDFLTSPDETQSGALLNECANLPGFVSALQCTDIFSTNVQFGDIPTDPFDDVGLRENPAGAGARKVTLGCTPACSAGVTVEFPDPPTGPTDGEDNPGGDAHDPDSDPDCFKDCGKSNVVVTVTVSTTSADTLVGLWFAGHLAESADPLGAAIGWGTGCNGGSSCGSSAIAGAPFHLMYICLQEPSDTSCESVGNRDNQIQSGGVPAPGSVTIVKDAIPNDPQDFSFTGDLGSFLLEDDGDEGDELASSMTFTGLVAGSYAVTETVAAGWTLTGLSCVGDTDSGSVITSPTVTIDVDSGEDITCTFTNTLNSANFTVKKDFSDKPGTDTTTVSVTLSCASGTVTGPNPKNSSELNPAVFEVTGFSGDPNCTATESPIPAGYTSSGTCNAALVATGQCTITNTLRIGTVTVNKDFIPDSTADVTVGLVCTSGTITNDDTTA